MKGTIQPDWNSKVDLSTQGAADLFNTLSTSGGFSLTDEIPVNISGTPYKVTGQTLANTIGSGGAQQAGLTNYVKNCGTISSLPVTLTDTNITSDMIILEATLGTPSVLTSNLNVTTANGSVTISGSISGSTTLTIVFGVGYTVAPTILTNLASNTPDNILKADPRPGVTGVLPVENGGTNASTAAAARTNLDVYSKSETNSAIQQSTANISTLKSGETTVGNIICAGYNTGSGNYFDFFVPINAKGLTPISASASSETLIFTPTGRIEFSSQPSITVTGSTDNGVRLEVRYPSTQALNVCGTIYAIALKIVCQ